jgi:hypothetical protein
VDYTKSYISSVYPEKHPHCGSVYAIYSQGYCDQEVEEINPLNIDGMICEQPSEIFKRRIIATILAYEEGEFLLISVVNQFKNLFFNKNEVPLVYCLTRQICPSQTTLNNIAQELLLCGLNPNYFIKIDHTIQINDEFTFDNVDYESTETSFSMTKSMVSTRGLSIENNSPDIEQPAICPENWKIKLFASQQATIAFQGEWILQCVTPAYMEKQCPLSTGLLCNTFPSTKNKLIFEDTTPCNNKDFNSEFKLTDVSFNLCTQTLEIQEALLCPAYKDSQYAIFNVGSQSNYKDTLANKYPFMDDKLFRYKIGQGICKFI